MDDSLAPSTATSEVKEVQKRIKECQTRIRILRVIAASAIVVSLVIFFVLIDKFLGKKKSSTQTGKRLELKIL